MLLNEAIRIARDYRSGDDSLDQAIETLIRAATVLRANLCGNENPRCSVSHKQVEFNPHEAMAECLAVNTRWHGDYWTTTLDVRYTLAGTPTETMREGGPHGSEFVMTIEPER